MSAADEDQSTRPVGSVVSMIEFQNAIWVAAPSGVYHLTDGKWEKVLSVGMSEGIAVADSE